MKFKEPQTIFVLLSFGTIQLTADEVVSETHALSSNKEVEFKLGGVLIAEFINPIGWHVSQELPKETK